MTPEQFHTEFTNLYDDLYSYAHRLTTNRDDALDVRPRNVVVKDVGLRYRDEHH